MTTLNPIERIAEVTRVGMLSSREWQSIYRQKIAPALAQCGAVRWPTAILIGNAPGHSTPLASLDLLPELVGQSLQPIATDDVSAQLAPINLSIGSRAAVISASHYLPLHPSYQKKDLTPEQADGALRDVQRWVYSAAQDAHRGRLPFIAEVDWSKPEAIEGMLRERRRGAWSTKARSAVTPIGLEERAVTRAYIVVPTGLEERVASCLRQQKDTVGREALLRGTSGLQGQPVEPESRITEQSHAMLQLLAGDKVDLVFVDSRYRVLYDSGHDPRRHDPAFLYGVLQGLKSRAPTRTELFSLGEKLNNVDDPSEGTRLEVSDLQREIAEQSTRLAVGKKECDRVYREDVRSNLFPGNQHSGLSPEKRRAIIVITNPSPFNGNAAMVIGAARDALATSGAVACVDLDVARQDHPLFRSNNAANVADRAQIDEDLRGWADTALKSAGEKQTHVVITSAGPPNGDLARTLAKLQLNGIPIGAVELRVVVPTGGERAQDNYGWYAQWVQQYRNGGVEHQGVGSEGAAALNPAGAGSSPRATSMKPPEEIVPLQSPYQEHRSKEAIVAGVQLGIRHLVCVSREGQVLYNSREDSSLQASTRLWGDSDYFTKVLSGQRSRVPTDQESARLFNTWAQLLPILQQAGDAELLNVLRPAMLGVAAHLADSAGARAELVKLHGGQLDQAVIQSRDFAGQILTTLGDDLKQYRADTDHTKLGSAQTLFRGPFHTGLRVGSPDSRTAIVMTNTELAAELQRAPEATPAAVPAVATSRPSTRRGRSTITLNFAEVEQSRQQAIAVATNNGFATRLYNTGQGLDQLHGFCLLHQADHHLVFTTEVRQGQESAAIIVSRATFTSNQQAIPSLGTAYQHPGGRSSLSRLAAGRADADRMTTALSDRGDTENSIPSGSTGPGGLTEKNSLGGGRGGGHSR